MRRGALALAALAGCAVPQPVPAPAASLALAGALLTLEAEAFADSDELARLAPLAAEALPPLQRWGGLRAPTRIVVVPSHAALEARAHRAGYGWLRAWARYDVVYVQALRSWEITPPLPEVQALLTHELAHCAMYQAASSGDDWARKEIPLWFREGLASWTAKQGGKRLSREELRRALDARPDVNPFVDAEQRAQREDRLVYGAAHWAFAALEQLGDARILSLLEAMRRGWTFPTAFAQIYGDEPQTFEARTLAELRGP